MAKQYTYEVIGTNTGYVPNVGVIVDGKIESDVPLEGHNFKLISGDAPAQAAPVVGTASQQNPAQPATAGNPTQPVNQGDTK